MSSDDSLLATTSSDDENVSQGSYSSVGLIGEAGVPPLSKFKGFGRSDSSSHDSSVWEDAFNNMAWDSSAMMGEGNGGGSVDNMCTKTCNVSLANIGLAKVGKKKCHRGILLKQMAVPSGIPIFGPSLLLLLGSIPCKRLG
jgi:hypothetical protein